MGLITGVITARALGPDGKGTLAVIAFLASLFATLGTIGLGDVAMVWFGRGRLTLQATISRILPVALIGVLVAAGLFTASGFTALARDGDTQLAVVAGIGAVALNSFYLIAASSLNAVHEFRVTSFSVAVGSVSTAALTALLVVLLPLDVFGATLALVGGWMMAMLPLLTRLHRRGLQLHPVFDRDFLRAALPYGARVIFGGTFILLTGRLDVFLVYSLDGEGAAGRYSVALTLASLAAMAPLALTYAAFPRFAAAPERGADELTARTSRQTLVLASVVAIALAAATPVLVPIAFGTSFKEAIAPTLILLVGYVLSSLQWVLTRSLAARGAPEIMARSWGLTLVTMIIADIPLILTLGGVGAALGFGAATVFGLSICLWRYRRDAGSGALATLVPRRTDITETLTRGRALALAVVRRLARG